MSLFQRVGPSASRKILRRATKGIPFVGAAIAVGLLAHTIKKKGKLNGVLDTTLDAVPFVGLFKFGVELFTGDWFPDKAPADPPGNVPPDAPVARPPSTPDVA